MSSLSHTQDALIARIHSHPQEARKIFTQLHNSTIDLPDDSLDEALGLTPSDTEKNINRLDLDDAFGIEQFVYEGTPYNFTRWFLHVLDPTKDDIVYDLGSGYGRVPIYGALTTPARYKGIEIVPERVTNSSAVARRFGLKSVEFHSGNVLKYDLSDGTIFFLFNPFVEKTFRQVLSHLEKIAQTKRIRIVAWGGGRTDYLQNEPWLHNLTAESDSPSLYHHRISIYKSI